MVLLTGHGVFLVRPFECEDQDSDERQFMFSKICPCDPGEFKRLNNDDIESRGATGLSLDDVFSIDTRLSESQLSVLLMALASQSELPAGFEISFRIDGVDEKICKAILKELCSNPDVVIDDESCNSD